MLAVEYVSTCSEVNVSKEILSVLNSYEVLSTTKMVKRFFFSSFQPRRQTSFAAGSDENVNQFKK